MSRSVLSPNEWQHQIAVFQFFDNIPEVATISGLEFQRSTTKRIYFRINNIVLHSGINYSAHIFVRKSNLSVEFCNEKTGEIITSKILQLFQNHSKEGLENIQ